MKNLFCIIACSFVLASCRNNVEQETLHQQVQSLKDSLKYYHAVSDSLNETAVNDSSQNSSLFGSHEIAKLRMHGLRNAPQQIIDDLQKRTDLIPQQGGLGGTMRIWNVQLIKTQWAIAEYTDGHATGTLLLNYKLQDDGQLQWKVLDEYLD